MVYTVWVDADGFCTAELQSTVETAGQAKKEQRELRAMDCGKIVVQVHASFEEAEWFADYVAGQYRAIKVATLYKRFIAAAKG